MTGPGTEPLTAREPDATGVTERDGVHLAWASYGDGPVTLLTHGVLGDVQGDSEHHGGIFKAVYAYSREVREAFAPARVTERPL